MASPTDHEAKGKLSLEQEHDLEKESPELDSKDLKKSPGGEKISSDLDAAFYHDSIEATQPSKWIWLRQSLIKVKCS
ncbi:hypothetical protein BT69DRAFT_631323 [Atractiella rhizophila]|nr:hypothetical protein BT69DRAFT_631323 [Atractiella rhizophila]